MAPKFLQLDRDQLTKIRALPTFDQKLKLLLHWAPNDPGNSRKGRMRDYLQRFTITSDRLLNTKRKESNPAILDLYALLQVIPRRKLPMSSTISTFIAECNGKKYIKNYYSGVRL